MTRHEAHTLVITAVGDLPMVRRIDYVANEAGEGVVIEATGGMGLPVPRVAPAGYCGLTLEDHTVETLRALFLRVHANTVQYHAQQAENIVKE